MHTERLIQLDANVDDIDPRVLPYAIDRLLDVGARDAWVTPIVMKKGRPAFTISALTDDEHLATVRDTVFRETSTIGVRETVVTRHALDRTATSVELDDDVVGVKVATSNGDVVNAGVEWSDVERIARATGRPAIEVLADAEAAARDRPS